MLHSYAFSNFRSFRERVEVSCALTEKDAVRGWDHTSRSNQRFTTAMAVLGANASGKTSLILPLAFLHWFVKYSFNSKPDSGIPVAPHFNGEASSIDFEVIVDAPEPETETLLRYRLSVTTKWVLAESLERKVRRGHWSAVFDRRRALDGSTGVMQEGFGLDQANAEKVRPDVSLISWAAQFGVPLASTLTSFGFTTNMFQGGRLWEPQDRAVDQCVQQYAENPSLRKQLPELLGRWDLGLSDLELREGETHDAAGQTQKRWYAYGVHRDGAKTRHTLPLLDESSGTKAAFALLIRFLPVLEQGGVIAWDELDSDLHPHLLEAVLDLFASPKTNPRGAQIIFTCHSVEVLKLLQKSQIVLVEKDGLDSSAWRLDSMDGVRSDENRAAKYLAGAYGAVPRL
jgi:putative AbiEii toxin of type IV toxin-antitoxin system